MKKLPPVLDACCGSRMFWFDKCDSRAVYVDRRRESHTLTDLSSKGGTRKLVIDPDIQCDLTAWSSTPAPKICAAFASFATIDTRPNNEPSFYASNPKKPKKPTT